MAFHAKTYFYDGEGVGDGVIGATFPFTYQDKNAVRDSLKRSVTYPPRSLPPLPKVDTVTSRSEAVSNTLMESYNRKTERKNRNTQIANISSVIHFSNDLLLGFDEPCPYVFNGARQKNKTQTTEKHFQGVTSKELGRHNTRGTDLRHMPCHLTESINNNNRSQNKLEEIGKGCKKTSNLSLKGGNRETIATLEENIPEKQLVPKQKREEWDEYIISRLSKDTAERLLAENTPSKNQKRLENCIAAQNASDHTSTISETNVIEKEIEKDISSIKIQDSEDPLEEINKKVSSFVEKKNNEKVNNKHGSKFLDEIQHGAQPLKTKRGDQIIVLDSDPKVLYSIKQQKVYPPQPASWNEKQNKEHSANANTKVEKGRRKWTGYPTVIEEDLFSLVDTRTVEDKSTISLEDDGTAVVETEEEEEIDLIDVVNEWRKEWFTDRQWENCSMEELCAAMNNINSHIRFAAVSSCCQALMKMYMNARRDIDLGIKRRVRPNSVIPEVEESLVDLLVKITDDSCQPVAFAAALTLCALNQKTPKAEDILINEIKHGAAAEGWASAQCLAALGCTNDVVVGELISNAMSLDKKHSAKAAKLLSKLSTLTTSIQFMVAEQLNDLSWKKRAIACNIVPLLGSSLSRDICHKLSHLMWNDWSSDVRHAAATALGKTGQGKLVHDQLIHRLSNGKELEKLDALKRISALGIMTTKLQSMFLKCLDNEHLAVRMEALKTCSNLQLANKNVLQRLMDCAKHDESSKVKSMAWEAIAYSGTTEEVAEPALWALCYEREPGVRISACRAVAALSINDDKSIKILQERIQVESDDEVKCIVALVLKQFGQDPTGDLSMKQAVQIEVKNLCRRSNVAKAILETEDIELQNKLIKNGHILEDYGEAVLTEAFLRDKPDSRASSRGFDPVLEGFRLRERSSPFPETSLFEMERPYLPYEVNTDSSDNESTNEVDQH